MTSYFFVSAGKSLEYSSPKEIIDFLTQFPNLRQDWETAFWKTIHGSLSWKQYNVAQDQFRFLCIVLAILNKLPDSKIVAYYGKREG